MPASRQFRHPDLSPVHFVFLCRQDSHARRTWRRWNLPGEGNADSAPSARRGMAIFLAPSSDSVLWRDGMEFSCEVYIRWIMYNSSSTFNGEIAFIPHWITDCMFLHRHMIIWTSSVVRSMMESGYCSWLDVYDRFSLEQVFKWIDVN